jgi:hypothetical protein
VVEVSEVDELGVIIVMIMDISLDILLFRNIVGVPIVGKKYMPPKITLS